MHRIASLVFLSAVSRLGYALASEHPLRVVSRQEPEGPVAPGTAADCTYYVVPISRLENCEYLEDFWGISHKEFVDWNPSVKDDCSGIKLGNSYCVEVNSGKPRETISTSTVSSRPTSASTSAVTSPTPSGRLVQPGIVAGCKDWYRAVEGDDCNKVLRNYADLDLSQFIKWNPAVNEDCSGLWKGYSYCVGTPDKPATTKVGAPEPTGCTSSGVPKPTQPGAGCRCSRWHQVKSGDDCWAIMQRYQIEESQLREWNPGLNEECTVWKDYYVCVGA